MVQEPLFDVLNHVFQCEQLFSKSPKHYLNIIIFLTLKVPISCLSVKVDGDRQVANILLVVSTFLQFFRSSFEKAYIFE